MTHRSEISRRVSTLIRSLNLRVSAEGRRHREMIEGLEMERHDIQCECPHQVTRLCGDASLGKSDVYRLCQACGAQLD